MQLPASAESGSTDLIDYDNPADLLCALLQQLGGTASISKLCKVRERGCEEGDGHWATGHLSRVRLHY